MLQEHQNLFFKPICLHLNFNTRETFLCRNFYFSIPIPGQLILKAYNQVILPRKKSEHLLFPVWVLVFCLFENTELKPSVTELRLYLKHFKLHVPFLFRWRTEVDIILFAVYFCFVKFLNILEISTGLQQYGKVTVWEKNSKNRISQFLKHQQ